MNLPGLRKAVAIAFIANMLLLVGCQKAVEPATSPQVAEQTEAEKTPKSPWEGNGVLKAVFPDANAEKSIPLDYQTFTFIEGNGLAITPLPPYLKAATSVLVAPSTGGYDLRAGNEHCESKIVIKMDGQTVADLDPKAAGNTFHLQVEPVAGTAAKEKQLEIWLAPDAKVNFNCNVTITPVK